MTCTRIVAIAALVLGLSGTANAATLTLEATALNTLSGDLISDFSVTFEDTGNGLLDRAEITAFSGVQYQRAGTTVPDHYTVIDMIPLLTGLTNGIGDRWAMATASGGTLLGAENWSYRLRTNETSAVPVPAAGLLLPMALAGLGLARGRKRQS